MENIFVEFLPPWVETGIQPAFYDKESGSVLQQTARMYTRVNMLIRMFNKLSKNTKTTVENYIKQFNQLHDYVHDYFDNLDVQEEINNKLDAMVEDGTFTNLITPILEEYNEELKNFEKLMNWHNIQYQMHRDETAETDYFITEIPFNNPYGGNNIIRVGIANDDTTISSVEKPSAFAIRHESPTVINAGIFYSNASNPTAYGLVIKDGTVLKNETLPNRYYRDILAIKEDGSIKTFPVGTNPQVILNEGYLDAIVIYYTLIENGQVVDYSQYSDTGVNPRQILCRRTNGNYLILTSEGRTLENKGLNLDDVVRILSSYDDIDFAFCLDGGGSTSTIVKGSKINKNIDKNGLEERKVATMLYVASTNSELYDMIGKINNANQIKQAETDLKYRQLPTIDSYFSGNLFDCYDSNFLTNKYISGGEIVDYTNTGTVGNDVMLSDYIQIPADTYIYVVNSSDFTTINFYDKDKRHIGAINYKDSDHLERAFKTPVKAVYCRVNIRRNILTTFGIYVGDTYSEHHELCNRTRPKVLYSNPSGASTGISVGYVLQYYKIKVYVTDTSSQQYCQEMLTNTAGGSLWTVFSRVNTVNTDATSIIHSRITINKTSGDLTIDREYHTNLYANDTITITAESDPRLKITRIEATI